MASFEVTGEAVKTKVGGGGNAESSNTNTPPMIHDLTSQFVGITVDINDSADDKRGIAAAASNKSTPLVSDSTSVPVGEGSSSSTSSSSSSTSSSSTSGAGWKSFRLSDPSEFDARGGATIIEVRVRPIFDIYTTLLDIYLVFNDYFNIKLYLIFDI